MHAFEYLVGLASIIIGLALADLASSLHKLLRARRRVRWHWHAPVSALILVLLVLDVWWGLRQLERAGLTMTIGLFLPLLVALFVCFLLAASALPDEVPEQGVDLKSYYAENGRYFWSLFALFVVLASAHVLAISYPFAVARPDGLWRLVSGLLPNLVVATVAISLAYVRRSWWHSVALGLLLAALLAAYLSRPLN